MLHNKTLSQKIIIKKKVKVKAVYSEELSKATLSHETYTMMEISSLTLSHMLATSHIWLLHNSRWLVQLRN